MTANSRCSVAEPPGLETQRREIECLLRESELQAGDSWYVVDRRWFEQWKEFVESGDQNSSSFPGQIDNTELFEDLDSYHLKERLVENEDFMLVPAAVWHKLLQWFGMVDGQPALERKVSPPEPRWAGGFWVRTRVTSGSASGGGPAQHPEGGGVPRGDLPLSP
uniref:ubiquitinyl hydrolase 1 n=1 Tax=Poecilia reticulata TaxID=8081 RepID=A0A3P9NAP0_POERE